MARSKPTKPDAIEEIQSGLDRVAETAAAHRTLIFALAGAILLAAAAYGAYDQIRSRRVAQASEALAAVTADYREAMGGSPSAVEVPEPANPETARGTREEYAERFLEVAREHAGTAPAVVAVLEAGNRRAELGDSEGARQTWEEARGMAGGGSPLYGLLLLRLAGSYEDAGDFAAAADVLEEAGAIEGFPLRYFALADAARCRAEAGDPERALQLFDRVEAEAPGLPLPVHVRARLQELRAARSGGAAPATLASE